MATKINFGNMLSVEKFWCLTAIPLLFLSIIFWSETFAQFNQIQKIVASDRAITSGAGDNFGASISISGNYAIIGTPNDDRGSNNAGRGSAYIFEKDANGNWMEVQKLILSGYRDPGDNFGNSVSISGNYAIVGAWNYDLDAAGQNYLAWTGIACIYERDGSGNWIEGQKLVAPVRSWAGHFGTSVAISGKYAFVSTSDTDESVYVFKRNGIGIWVFVQKLICPDLTLLKNGFGCALSISGNYAVIGAYQENKDAGGGNSLNNAGAAYIYECNSSSNWNYVQKIVASDRGTGDNFGNLSISISGTYILANAFGDGEDDAGGNTLAGAGSAYIFERNGSSNWVQKQKLVASDRAANDGFGWYGQISGNYAVVGAAYEDEDASGGNTLNNAGSAYVYQRMCNGNWQQVQKIVASDRAVSSYFNTPAISGNDIIVGASYERKDAAGLNSLVGAGAAYVYRNITDSLFPNICFSSTYILPSGTVVNSGGTYNDTLTNIYGCDSIITVVLTIAPEIASSQSANICFGSTYTLPGGTIVNSGGTYNDTLIAVSGCDSIIVTTLTVKPLFSSSLSASICSGSTHQLPDGTIVNSIGTYTTLLSSVAGCDSIITTALTINPAPTVTAGSDVIITMGESTTLSATGGSTYLWTPSTGLNCPTCNNPVANPQTKTKYCVEVIDGNGCSEDTCVTITVDTLCEEIFVPTAFSPNDDGENDLECVFGDCIESINFNIYDRWGEKVFEYRSSPPFGRGWGWAMLEWLL